MQRFNLKFFLEEVKDEIELNIDFNFEEYTDEEIKYQIQSEIDRKIDEALKKYDYKEIVYQTTADDLEDLFKKYGQINDFNYIVELCLSDAIEEEINIDEILKKEKEEFKNI